MNREIKFRGKRTDNGQFVYGSLFKLWSKTYIIRGTTIFSFGISTLTGIPDMVEVVPETIGQFTSLVDKNDVECYEGDYIKIYQENGATYGEGFISFTHYGFHVNDMPLIHVVLEDLDWEIIQ